MQESNDTKAARRKGSDKEPMVSEFATTGEWSSRLRNVLREYIRRWGDVKPSEVEQGKFLLLPRCWHKTWHDFELARDKYR